MPTALEEKQGALDQKRSELNDIFEKYPNMDMDVKTVEDIRNRNQELDNLGKEVENLISVKEIADRNHAAIENGKERGAGLPTNRSRQDDHQRRQEDGKSFGEIFTESKAFTEYQNGRGPAVEIEGKSLFERKTVFDTSTGYAPQAIRINKLVPYAVETPMVADLIPQGTTSQNAIKYMEETTLTNAADATSEAGAFPESALGYTEKSSDVRKISTFLPVTDEMVEDVPGIQSIVNSRLGLFLQMKEETELMAGSGTAPHLRGLLNTVGIQTQAKGVDPTPDAIYKGMTLIRINSFLRASGIVMHPNDWQGIRLLRTTEGIYIWGNPSEAGPERIWGLPVVQSTSMTENTALLAAFDTSMQIFRKRNITIEISNSHADYFTNGKLAIRADERLALVVFRPSAICTVTGI